MNEEYTTLFRCPICNQIYKLHKVYDGDFYDGYISDFNDVFMVDKHLYSTTKINETHSQQSCSTTPCIKCKNVVEFGANTKVSPSWVADKVFEIKG